MENPYSVATRVEPTKEKQILTSLRSNPKELQKLGLASNEDFTVLKNNPAKYNKVMSYVKSQAYGGPAYGAIGTGQSKGEFTSSQLGKYGETPTEHTKGLTSDLESKYRVPELKQRYQGFEEREYTAPYEISEQIKEKGGYDVEKYQDQFSELRTNYANAYRDFVNGDMESGEYAKIVSELGTSQRNLEKVAKGYESEMGKGIAGFKDKMTNSKNQFDNAYAKFSKSLEDEKAGYTESREEKVKFAEDMYTYAKDILDESKSEQKEYQKALGKIYNPNTGKYESKPGTGTGATSKMFAKADVIRKDLQNKTLDWGQAFNRIKVEFPSVEDSQIDKALGGSAGFDAGTGEFDPAQATGFAREGTVQEDGGYTTQEVRKLRNANIDPADITKSDSFLYGNQSQPTMDEKTVVDGLVSDSNLQEIYDFIDEASVEKNWTTQKVEALKKYADEIKQGGAFNIGDKGKG